MSDLYTDADLYHDMNKDYIEDLPYWEAHARKAKHPVLELACGSGRVSIELAKKGLKFHGIDLEHKMVKFAQNQAKAENLDLNFFQGDIRKSLGEQKYDLIIFPFNSFCHLHTKSDRKNFFDCVKESLTEDGLLIIHIFMPLFEFLDKGDGLQEITQFHARNRDLYYTVYEKNAYNNLTQMNEIDWYFEPDDEGETLHRHLSLRVYFPEELRLIIEDHGFHLEGIDGDYEQKAAHENSKALLFRIRPK